MSDRPSIHQVQTRQDRRDFLNVPAAIYGNDPCYIRQPGFEERARIAPESPYFEHGHAALFVARDAAGTAVGRISAQINDLAQPDNSQAGRRGHFGFLEAANEPPMKLLLETAESWLAGQGITEVSGPYSFSINEEAGLLVEGHDDPPKVLMNYAPPWYGEALEKFGFAKAKDLLAFRFEIGTELELMAKSMAARASAIPELQERFLDKSRFDDEIRTVANLFNDAWSENWGFVPMTETEIAHMAKALKPILVPELVRIVEVSGEPAGMIVALPDMNEALAGLDGRLLPLGWAKLLWRLKVRGLSRARVILMGISSAWSNDLRSAAIAALLVDKAYSELCRRGYRELEMSWILEDNAAMIRLIEMVGGRQYKRYRVYQKQLA